MTLTVMSRKVIVAGILGALAVGTVAAWYRSSDLRCSIDQPCSQLMAVEGAIHMYMLDTGHVPENLNDLLSASVPGSRGPYIVKGALIDPKGRPIDYKVQSKSRDFRLSYSQPHLGLARSCPSIGQSYTENDG